MGGADIETKLGFEDFMDDGSMDVGESTFDTVMVVAEALVIET